MKHLFQRTCYVLVIKECASAMNKSRIENNRGWKIGAGLERLADSDDRATLS